MELTNEERKIAREAWSNGGPEIERIYAVFEAGRREQCCERGFFGQEHDCCKRPAEPVGYVPAVEKWTPRTLSAVEEINLGGDGFGKGNDPSGKPLDVPSVIAERDKQWEKALRDRWYGPTGTNNFDLYISDIRVRLTAPTVKERVTISRSEFDAPHQVTVWLDGKEECCNMIQFHAERYANGLRAEIGEREQMSDGISDGHAYNDGVPITGKSPRMNKQSGEQNCKHLHPARRWSSDSGKWEYWCTDCDVLLEQPSERVIPEDLREWFLHKLADSVTSTWGPPLLRIPDDKCFYASYSKKQMLADAESPKHWSYWNGIQDFPVKLTVAELMMLIQEAQAALDSRDEKIRLLRDALEDLTARYAWDHPDSASVAAARAALQSTDD